MIALAVIGLERHGKLDREELSQMEGAVLAPDMSDRHCGVQDALAAGATCVESGPAPAEIVGDPKALAHHGAS